MGLVTKFINPCEDTMSTSASAVPPPLPSDDTRVDSARQVERRLRATRAQVKLVDLTTGLLTLAVGVCLTIAVAVLIDHWLFDGGLSSLGRFAFFTLLVAGVLWQLARIVLPALVRRVHSEYAAEQIERAQPSLKNSLINFLQLRGAATQLDPTVYRKIEQRAASDLQHINVEATVDKSSIIRLGYVLSGLLVVSALYLVLSPKSPLVSMGRVIAPWAEWNAPTRVQIADVQPGNDRAFLNSRVKITAHIIGLRKDERPRVEYSSLDGQVKERQTPLVASDTPHVYWAEIPDTSAGVQQDLLYQIIAGDARTSWYALRAVPMPAIAVTRLDYEYPKYSGLPHWRVERQGDIRALEGTLVTITAQANSDIVKGWIDLGRDGRRDDPLKVKGRDASVTIPLRLKHNSDESEFRNYVLVFDSADGGSPPQPIEYHIEVVRDQPPQVAFVEPVAEPEKEQPLGTQGTLPLKIDAHDPDFKLAEVKLLIERDGKKLAEHRLLKEPRAGRLLVSTVLDAKALNVHVGELIHYSAIAVDNKQPKPNETRTAKYAVRIVSPDKAPKPQEQLAQNEPKPGPSDKPQDNKPNEKNQPTGQKPAADSANKPPMKPSEQGNPDSKNPAKDPSEAGNKDKNDSQASGEKSGDKQDKNSSSKPKPNDGDQQQGKGQNQKADGAGGGEQGKAEGEKAGQTGKAGESAQGDDAKRGQSSGKGNDSKSGQPSGQGNEPPEGKKSDKASDQLASADNKRVDPESQPGDAIEKINEHFNAQGKPNSAGKNDPSKSGATQQQPKTGQGDTSAQRAADQQPSQGPRSPQANSADKSGQGDKARGVEQPQENQPGGQKSAEKPEAQGGDKDGAQGNAGAGKASDKQGNTTSPQESTKPRDKPQSPGSTDQDKNSSESPGSPSRSKQESDAQGDSSGDQSGGGKQGGGQRSNQSGTGGAGTNTAAEDGGSQAQGRGQGPASDKGGDQIKANRPTEGKSSGEKGSGSQSQSGGDKSGGPSAPDPGVQPQGNQQGTPSESGQAPNKSNGKKNDEPRGKESSGIAEGGGGQGNPLGGGVPSEQSGRGVKSAPVDLGGEDPNLEYARQATDLAVERLADQMQKGQLDPKLLDKLKWTAEDAQRFVQRWRELKQQAQEPGPKGEQGRERLDDTLRSLGLQPRGTTLRGDSKSSDQQRDLRESRRSKPPAEYADQFRAFSTGEK